MLAEINDVKQWNPRWYYIMQNKTTGMKYVGQTYNLESRSYCGSGQYWTAHCKKYGGHNRKNIDVVERFYASTEQEAQTWLDAFESKNPDYFVRSNDAWANRARETTQDSAFCGLTKDQRIEYATLGGFSTANNPGHMSRMASIQGKINAESGHMKEIQKIGCSLGGKIAGKINGKKAVENGQLAKAAIEGGRKIALMRHAEKDESTGKSLFAVKIGQKSGETKKLMRQFCKEQGIIKPGINYVNIDRNAFNQWRISHAC